VKRIIEIFILGAFSVGASSWAKAPTLLVTPNHFECRVERADIPEAEEMGQTPYRVNIRGARGKFDWRLPLYRSNNGYNDIATAQIGHATADRHNGFIIAVTSYELAKVGTNPLILEVSNESGSSARCPLVESSASIAARDRSLKPVRGAVAR